MNNKKEYEIKIKVGDWHEEYQQEEPVITSEDDLLKLVVDNKLSTAKIGRLAIMARETGNAPADIIPANKLVLQTGAALYVSSLIAPSSARSRSSTGC